MIDVLRPRTVASLSAAHAPQYAFALSGQSPLAVASSLPISDDAFDAFADEADFDLVSLQPEPEIDYFDDEEPSHAPELPMATPQAVAVISQAPPDAEAATDMAPALATIDAPTTDAPQPFQFTSIGTMTAAEPTASALPLEAPQTISQHDWAADDHAPEVAPPQPVDEWGAEGEKAVTDPWAEPLPASEYSQNEWPLLLMAGQERPKRVAKWLLLAAALLIVATAAVYFIIIEPGKKSSSEQSTIAQANEPTKPADQSAHQQTISTAAVPPVSEKPAAPAPALTNNASAPQWKNALQAMASQNQAEALQLAERLKGAGVPAYMVVADLGSRGRWFRVRIGGFATPADAQRFAAEVRTRARVAGVPLKDLNVCDYEKP